MIFDELLNVRDNWDALCILIQCDCHKDKILKNLDLQHLSLLVVENILPYL